MFTLNQHRLSGEIQPYGCATIIAFQQFHAYAAETNLPRNRTLRIRCLKKYHTSISLTACVPWHTKQGMRRSFNQARSPKEPSVDRTISEIRLKTKQLFLEQLSSLGTRDWDCLKLREIFKVFNVRYLVNTAPILGRRYLA